MKHNYYTITKTVEVDVDEINTFGEAEIEIEINKDDIIDYIDDLVDMNELNEIKDEISNKLLTNDSEFNICNKSLDDYFKLKAISEIWDKYTSTQFEEMIKLYNDKK